MMDLREKIAEDLKEAMRSRHELRRSTLRLVRSALLNREKELRRSLSDEEVLVIVTKEAKKRREAAHQFGEAGRGDLQDRENAELAVLEEYLPRQLDRDEILAIARPVVEALQEPTPASMGQVMGRVMPQVKGRADGKLVNQIIRELLGG